MELGYFIGGFGVLASLCLWVVIIRVRKRRFISGGFFGVLLCLFISLAMVSAAFVVNLHSYRRLIHEDPIANLRITELAPQHYRVHLWVENRGEYALELLGDEWQLDARILKWEAYATWIGFDPLYRLERISGRYTDLRQETSAPRSAHSLAIDEGLDLWSLARHHPRWLPFVDAVYGSAAYLPLRDGAEYEITLGASGLIARFK